MRLHGVVVLLLHALAGWAYCGMLIGVGQRFLSMDATLVVHAVGAPIGFALLSFNAPPAPSGRIAAGRRRRDTGCSGRRAPREAGAGRGAA